MDQAAIREFCDLWYKWVKGKNLEFRFQTFIMKLSEIKDEESSVNARALAEEFFAECEATPPLRAALFCLEYGYSDINPRCIPDRFSHADIQSIDEQWVGIGDWAISA